MVRKHTSQRNFPLIRAALILFAALVALYIPLKIYLARSENPGIGRNSGTVLSIFVTNELDGYREPCD